MPVPCRDPFWNGFQFAPHSLLLFSVYPSRCSQPKVGRPLCRRSITSQQKSTRPPPTFFAVIGGTLGRGVSRYKRASGSQTGSGNVSTSNRRALHQGGSTYRSLRARAKIRLLRLCIDQASVIAAAACAGLRGRPRRGGASDAVGVSSACNERYVMSERPPMRTISMRFSLTSFQRVVSPSPESFFAV